MWEDEIIDDFDYKTNLKMLAESKKKPEDMSDTELKRNLKTFKAWYPGQAREEMVYMLTYWQKRDTQMARLKEACQMGSFGAPEEDIFKVRDEQFEKINQFMRPKYLNARACFISLIGFEKTWTLVPKVVLDNCLVLVNAKREWVFFKKAGFSASFAHCQCILPFKEIVKCSSANVLYKEIIYFQHCAY